MGTNPDDKAIERARESVERWQSRVAKLLGQIMDRFRSRTSAYIGCRHCGSKLSHSHLVDEGRGLLTTPPTCPLCDGTLIPQSELTRVMNLKRRVKRSREELNALVSGQ